MIHLVKRSSRSQMFWLYLGLQGRVPGCSRGTEGSHTSTCCLAQSPAIFLQPVSCTAGSAPGVIKLTVPLRASPSSAANTHSFRDTGVSEHTVIIEKKGQNTARNVRGLSVSVSEMLMPLGRRLLFDRNGVWKVNTHCKPRPTHFRAQHL